MPCNIGRCKTLPRPNGYGSKSFYPKRLRRLLYVLDNKAAFN